MSGASKKGVWKSGSGQGRVRPKGRQVDDLAWSEVKELLGTQPRRPDLLIEFLHLIQDEYGHISAVHMRALAEEMRLSQAEIYEVATFYAHFDVVKEDETPPPALTIRVCDSLSCELAGAASLQEALKSGLDSEEVRVLRAPCMGRCDTAPVLELGHHHIDNATPEKVISAIKAGHIHADIPNYQTLEAYKADGGYSELLKLRANGNWEDVQALIKDSGLRGLGGAGFPSGTKWGFVRGNAGPRYLAVNGDEGEPGTFKDRYYLERTPHLFLEGMLIAAWAVEAETCFIYMRDEYPAVLNILKTEIEALETLGLSKTLSQPSVFTLNNQEAKITQGTQIPFQTTSDGTTTTEFKEAALSLTVTPSIIGDGNVLLDILVNNDSPTTTPGTTEPAIKTNEIKTKLLVSDGDIVVIGGIKKNTVTNAKNRTPGVSKIPVVGNLFKGSAKKDELVELLIFIAPRVIE